MKWTGHIMILSLDQTSEMPVHSSLSRVFFFNGVPEIPSAKFHAAVIAPWVSLLPDDFPENSYRRLFKLS